MKDCRGMIFDLDGTLLDSMGVWSQIDVDFLAKRGIDLPEDYQRMVTPMGARQAADYTIERFHLSDTPEMLMEEWLNMAHEEYSRNIPLKPYAYEYVEKLYREGKKMAIATSSDRYLVMPALERTGLLPMMSAVVTAAEVRRGKGYPDIYEKAAGELGMTAAECAVYEDIIEGIRGAKAGGFLAVGVYEKQNAENYDLIRREADVYIHSFRELL